MSATSTYPSVHPCINSSLDQSIHLLTYQRITYSPTDPSTHLPVHPSSHPSIQPSIYPAIHPLSSHPAFHPSVSTYLSLFSLFFLSSSSCSLRFLHLSGMLFLFYFFYLLIYLFISYLYSATQVISPSLEEVQFLNPDLKQP